MLQNIECNVKEYSHETLVFAIKKIANCLQLVLKKYSLTLSHCIQIKHEEKQK